MLVAVAGCQASTGGARTELAIFAASSLTDAFEALEPDFERTHPGVDVTVATAGSQILRLQIERAAPADVYASANAVHIQALVEAGLVTQAEVFARNELVVVVPRDNPAGIEALADLPRATRIVLGTPEVPAGRYARQLLDAAASVYGPDFPSRVLANVVSQESNVRLVRAKVVLGEADAAIVYRSDTVTSEPLHTIEIPAALHPAIALHIGVVARSSQPELARQLIGSIRSPPGQRILSAHGFGAPP